MCCVFVIYVYHFVECMAVVRAFLLLYSAISLLYHYCIISIVLLTYCCLYLLFPPFQDGWTALHWAAHKGHVAIVTLLLEGGADHTIKKNVSAVVNMSADSILSESFCFLIRASVNLHIVYLLNILF